ncbi:ABC transporter substrate-binding protein [Paenibacillus koleovorans]|uniref:ABC transporter substrate-binding protein n=1 Tax=Paenibacillus koleovorans TaxID=121608 RepID=UPI000FDAA1B5|nr:ABC transporter substrate-binding protein [Paenibacillus koleovorans]
MKRLTRKWLVALPAVTLVTASVLGGCGSSDDGNKGTSASTTPSESTGTSAKPAATELKPVKLIWYYLGSREGDAEQVYAKANEIIKAKINATVDFQPLSNADYRAKMPLKLAAGEKFDLAYTSDNVNLLPYRDSVSKGGFIALDELIAKYAPQMKKAIPDNIWAATIIGGKIYAVPNYQISARTPGLMFHKAIVDKYNLKDKIKAVKKMSDLTPIFELVKKAEPNMYMAMLQPSFDTLDNHEKETYVETLDANIPVVVDFNLKVHDKTQGAYLQLMLEDAKLAREWQVKGFFHPDSGLAKDVTPDQRAGKFFVTRDNAKPGVEADYKNKFGYEAYVVPMGLPVLSTASISATLTGISRTSENPERAMMLLELINTDKELYNLLVHGIEGVDYKKLGPNRVEPMPGKPYIGTAWAIGNQFNAWLLPGQEDDVWEQTKKVNSTAVPAPTIGFSFDSTNVQTEIANIISVSKKFDKTYQIGMVEDYTGLIAQYSKELQAAGLPKYIAELQKQLDAWKATKK